MKFSTSAIFAVLSASTAFAAPAAEPDVSMMTTSQWTIQNMKRTCGGGTCNWSFGINQNDGNAATSCAFKVNGSPATQTDSNGNKCGKYTVSTGWSGQFGEGQGFTTLAVVDNNSKQIIYPAYTDKQLSGGKVVKPDQKYTPQNLPK
ncbi:hypothetical protein KC360_g2774 [Hortaea werneckii]|nr:hypothetical protein KC325_g3478 [Hortaea werneckii]KAI6996252.1 hypothetical protein KC359_g3583 [Hortaea werneckii]KAI7082880.1 hypothetical protein KC356_g8017 [Hortaea werneckii]KAI7146557.1 hypothetical protein KC344_g3529 [Hortaea werneckii]KAI7176855.1 hypothetical protein KC360_g2774 [Hortaea werneckii]